MPAAPPSSRERPSGGRRRRARGASGKPWGKWLLISLGALVVVAIGAYFAFGIWLQRYLRSDDFQQQLSARLGQRLNATTEFHGLSWGDNAVQLGRLTAKGYADAAFSQATVDDVRADVRVRLWEREVDIPSITVSRVNVTLDEAAKLPINYAPAQEGAYTETSASSQSAHSSWLEKYLPDKLTLGETLVDDFSASIKSPTGETRLQGLPLSIKTGQTLDSWTLESHPKADKARLITNLGAGVQVTFKDLRARIRPENFDLIQCDGDLEKQQNKDKRATDKSPTRLSLTGNFQQRALHGLADFDVKLTELALQDWVQEDWLKRLSGWADLNAKLTGDLSQAASLRLEGDFTLRKGILTSLPFLENLAEQTKTKEFTRLELNTAKWHFLHLGQQWLLTSIEVEAKGLMRLEGSLTITGENVQGVLEVGVTPGRLRALDGAEQKVFTREAKGYKWARPAMRISGTLDNIQEDLAARIKDAWFDQQIENVTDLATKAPEAIIDGGTKALEMGTKVLETGPAAAPDVIRSGMNLLQGLLPGR